jgi:hypothetical protein
LTLRNSKESSQPKAPVSDAGPILSCFVSLSLLVDFFVRIHSGFGSWWRYSMDMKPYVDAMQASTWEAHRPRTNKAEEIYSQGR